MGAQGNSFFCSPNFDLPKKVFSLQAGKGLFKVKKDKQLVDKKNGKIIGINHLPLGAKKEL